MLLLPVLIDNFPQIRILLFVFGFIIVTGTIIHFNVLKYSTPGYKKIGSITLSARSIIAKDNIDEIRFPK